MPSRAQRPPVPGRVLIPAAKVRARVRDLGKEIAAFYKDKPLTVVGLMNGSLFFLVDLLKHLPPQTRIECWRVSSYKGKKSTGSIQGLDHVQGDYAGGHVLIVDDILDSGLTLHAVRKKLRALNARSVKSCVLLDKKVMRTKKVRADWAGFPIGNEYVLGYGLDLDHAWRTLPEIRAVSPD